PSQGTFTGTTNLNFSLGTLEAGSNATITIAVSVATNATGTLTNTATVSVVSPADAVAANNTATAITTVQPPPSCLISGPSAVCPTTTNNIAAPAGLGSYGWSISGNGTIVGATNSQTLTVSATTPG